MIILNSIILWFTLLSLSNKKISTLISYLSIITFAIVIGLRDVYYGSDTPTYVNYFNEYTTLSNLFEKFQYKGDYLFFMIGWFVKQITIYPEVYIFFLSFLSIVIFYLSYLKLIKNYICQYKNILLYSSFFTSTILLIYANVIRQGLSISLIVLSIYLFSMKKFKSAFFILLCASFIHKAAFLFFIILPIVFIYNISIKKLLFFSVISLIFMKFNLLAIIIPEDFFIIGSILSGYANTNFNVDNLSLKIIVLSISLIYFYLVTTKNKEYYFNKLFKIYLFLYSFIVISYPFGKFCERLILYDSILLPILFFMTIKIFKQKMLMLFFYLIISSLYGIYVINHPSILANINF